MGRRIDLEFKGRVHFTIGADVVHVTIEDDNNGGPETPADRLWRAIVRVCGVAPKVILQPGRGEEAVVYARRMFCCVAADVLGYNRTRIGELIGRDHSSVSTLITRTDRSTPRWQHDYARITREMRWDEPSELVTDEDRQAAAQRAQGGNGRLPRLGEDGARMAGPLRAGGLPEPGDAGPPQADALPGRGAHGPG